MPSGQNSSQSGQFQVPVNEQYSVAQQCQLDLTVLSKVTVAPSGYDEIVREQTLNADQLHQANITAEDAERIWSLINDNFIQDVFSIKLDPDPFCEGGEQKKWFVTTQTFLKVFPRFSDDDNYSTISSLMDGREINDQEATTTNGVESTDTAGISHVHTVDFSHKFHVIKGDITKVKVDAIVVPCGPRGLVGEVGWRVYCIGGEALKARIERPLKFGQGSAGFSKADCIEAVSTAVTDYLAQNSGKTTVRDAYMILYDDVSLEIFNNMFKKTLGFHE